MGSVVGFRVYTQPTTLGFRVYPKVKVAASLTILHYQVGTFCIMVIAGSDCGLVGNHSSLVPDERLLEFALLYVHCNI
jgi:hypothetical protein